MASVASGARQPYVLALVRQPAGQHLEQDYSHSIYVHGVVYGVAPQVVLLLGRHITPGAAPRLERRDSSVSGYPEVGQLGRAVSAQQDVVRLDVPVDNAGFVGSPPARPGRRGLFAGLLV